MKKILFSFLLILFFLFWNKNFIYSQTPTPTIPFIGGMALPGVNCGDVQNNNKCCYNEPIKPGLINIGGPLQFVSDFINRLLEDKLTPLLQWQRQIKVEPCINGSPSTPGDLSNPNCICIKPTDAPLTAIKSLCDNVSPKEKQLCLDCLSGNNKDKIVGIWSGAGCIYANIGAFIQNTLLGWGIGLAGLVALLCIIYSAFQLQTSGGNPEKIKKAQELLTSCIMGLMLIIFSVFILRIIGVSILRIPGFR